MRLQRKWSAWVPIAMLMALCAVALGACGSDDSSSSSTESGSTASAPAGETAKVRFAAGPVFDAQLPAVGLEKGYFDEVGIDAEVRTAVELAQGTQALAAGSLDFAFQSLDVTIPQARTLDSVGWARIDDLWYGLSLVGRDGDFKTFDEFVEEGEDPKKALVSTLEQLRGKTLITFFRQWEGSLNGLLESVDLGSADEFFNIVDMPFQEGAVAFLRGEGDIYMGDLPGTFRVLEDDGVELTSARDWPPFPGSYIYVGWVANKDWMVENEDTYMRVMGVLFRIADDLSPRTLEANKLQDEALTVMYERVNEESGASFDLDAARWVNKDVSPWLTVDEMGEVLFDPKSPQNLDGMVDALTEVAGSDADPEAIAEQVGQLQPMYEKYVGYGKSAEKDIAAASGSGDAEVEKMVGEAEDQHAIFNYLDASTKAAAAVEAMEG
jgi:ABC-type nitrate/sulfonate/bicarbonate transport system substrate-binding protein